MYISSKFHTVKFEDMKVLNPFSLEMEEKVDYFEIVRISKTANYYLAFMKNGMLLCHIGGRFLKSMEIKKEEMIYLMNTEG